MSSGREPQAQLCSKSRSNTSKTRLLEGVIHLQQLIGSLLDDGEIPETASPQDHKLEPSFTDNLVFFLAESGNSPCRCFLFWRMLSFFALASVLPGALYAPKITTKGIPVDQSSPFLCNIKREQCIVTNIAHGRFAARHQSYP